MQQSGPSSLTPNQGQQLKVTPSFLLRGVDPAKVIADYKAGIYVKLIPPKSKGVIAEVKPLVAPTYGANGTAPVYSFQDHSNSTVVIATSNHAAYEIYNRTGEMPMGGRCARCRRDFTHRAMGVPIAMAEKLYTVKDGDNFSTQKCYIFWVTDIVCNFRCMLGEAQRLNSMPSDRRSIIHANSEQMTRFLFSLSYPNAGRLEASIDPSLLKENGGTVEQDPTDLNQRYIYVPIPLAILAPAKTQFIRTN
jgi:hypothetical protein